MEANDMTIKEVYKNILNVYDHFIHNTRSTPLSEDISAVGNTILSIYAFLCGKADLAYKEWYFINPNICVMVMNTKINNISIIIRTSKSATDKIECKFKCNSNVVHVQYKNKDTNYEFKKYRTKVGNEFTYGLLDYIRKNMSDEIRCWLILANQVKGVM